MAEKVTTMVLKVDLQCTKCYKKVKKLLCKYPQIRDQFYDEKANTVTIKVVCCSPEKIRDKLCRKGGGTIKSIEIKEPPKPKAPDPEKSKLAAEPEKPKPKPAAEQEKPKPSPPPADPKPAEKPKTVTFVEPTPPAKPPDQPARATKALAPAPAPAPAPKAAEPAPAPKVEPTPVLVAGYPPGPTYPQYGLCYVPYGYDACGNGMGMVAPPPCNCGCGGSRLVSHDNYGRNYNVNRCDYFSEENPSACTVM